MQTLRQSPTDPAFVQDPYPFYDRARAGGDLGYWKEYGKVAAFSLDAVNTLLKDRRFGRELPEEMQQPVEPRLAPFYDIDAHSMLELEPPRHTRLRGLVLRAFTSRRINALRPEIEALCEELVAGFPDQPFDLIPAYCTRVPVIVIARLLGVPDSMADDLLGWSNDMVAMYQARRDRAVEDHAVASARAFSDFMRGYVEERRSRPADDLITHLIAAEEEGERLTTEELITTCILLLNAGHEATVHTMGNGVKALLENGFGAEVLAPDRVQASVEEVLRHDPPLHMFSRWAYEEVELFGHRFRRGEEVALMLGAANRDPAGWDDPARFDPTRPVKTATSFGGGIHFCVGAPLARLELQVALPALFAAHPGLALDGTPRYANLYHFHGLESLVVRPR
ncbi:cytochrome P450 [Aquicoccus sp. SCR17]|nr:cytochrome P450 [Carideicomes alvinocaridis]